MNKTWVDQKLVYLSLHLDEKMKPWMLFDPIPRFYEQLASGDEQDLESVVTELGKCLRLYSLPSITYEWGLMMKADAAGQIRQQNGTRSHIQIPLFYVGKPHALGAILAHELSHEVLAQACITSDNIDELEMLTDLASIAVGMGRLVLNGTNIEDGIQTGEYRRLGYLDTALKAYAFHKVNQSHQVPATIANKHLIGIALHIMESVDSKPSPS